MLDLLKFDITALDRTGKVFAGLKSELGGIKGALAGVDDYARRTGRSMRNIGAGLSAAVTAPLTLLGKQSVELYDTQLQAEKTVQQAITSTGGAANRTLEELKKSASDLQGVTTFGDEDILRNVTAPLLTFTKVQDEVFDRAQANVLDMATLLKMDLKSASILVGKALNDPVKGLSALSRSGVQFSEDQKKVIQALVKTGDVAGAQALILQELETQFQGQAAAAASAPLGQWRQLSNAIGDVKEQLGEQVVPFLKPVVDAAKEGVAWFSRLEPDVKRNVVVFGGLAAATGPVVLGLGLITLAIPTAITLLGGMAGGMASVIAIAGRMGFAMYAALGPWGLLAGLVAAGASYFLVFRDNVQEVEPSLADVQRAQEALNGALGVFYTTAAPSAGAGAVDAANNYYQMASAAREAAAANLALLRSELAMQQGINSGLRFGNFFGADEERIIVGDLAAAEQELAEAERMLEMARTERARVTNRVMRSDADMAKVMRDLNAEVTVSIEGLKGLGGAAVGAGGKLKKAKSETDDLKKSAQELAQSAKSIDREFGATLSNIVRKSATAEEAIGRVLDSLADKILTNAFSNLFGNIGLGGIFAPLVASANGNVFQAGRVMPFASGGIVSSPTYFPMRGGTGLMGEAGPEAIMPLGRDSAGRLGVRAQGLGGAGARSQVEVVLRTEAGVTIEQVRQISGQTAVQVSQASSAIRDRQFAGRLTDTQNRRR